MPSVMQSAASALRSSIIAGPGRKLCVSDLANIEGRKLAWLAGETWKLDAFRAYDAGTGPDLYKLAYARSFDVPVESVTGDARQIGKVQELALGYEGGVGAFVSMAAVYGLDLERMALAAWNGLPQWAIIEANEFYEYLGTKAPPLSKKVFIVCDSIKRLWRKAHPATTALWKDLAGACVASVQNGPPIRVGEHLVVDKVGAWLRIRLPSGRYLCYPSPKVISGKLTFLGENPYSRQWQRLSTYSGKLTENVTQASSRDVLYHAMPRAEAAGYPIVLHVHDELVTEPSDLPAFTDEELSNILADCPPWALGLPLAAKGFTTYRYRKD